MDARQQKALVIAATARITRKGRGFRVPSQSMQRAYTVTREPDAEPTCTCPDHELRRLPCKHILAVAIVLRRETAPDGTVTETRAARITYAQDWPAYNAAQTTEKEHFCRLLHDLCKAIEEPPATRGRPRLPLRDMLFAAAFKVYSTQSARRFMTDLRDAQERGLIRRTPHYNSIFNYLESQTVTPVILDLITASSLPLRAVETDFAIDSTGFGTSTYFRFYSHKYERDQAFHEWVKMHAVVGVKTNVVTSVEVNRAGDSTLFKPLIERTAQNFAINEISADKAYLSHRNVEFVDQLGAVPYIPFKSNSRADGEGHAVWRKLFHFFSLHREEFLAHYHKRSNVETAFSAIKRVFGGAVRSKTVAAQINEVFLKVLCHNVRVLIHEMYELGITPEFERMVCPIKPAAAQQLPAT